MAERAEMMLGGFNRVPVERCLVGRAEGVEDVRRRFGRESETDLMRGAGRGYGDNALNAGAGVLLAGRMDRVIGFDEAEGIVTVEAGCTLGKIIDTFLPRGWFPLVTPGTKLVSVGGCIAADVHGKNHHRDGSFASSVIEFDLLTAAGETLTCSHESNADVFWATLGGMGLTGAILSARLRLRRVESAFVAVDYEQMPNLDTALSRFAETDQQSRYSVAWIDCLAGGESMGRSVLMRGDHAPAEQVPTKYRGRPLDLRPGRSWSIPFNFPEWALNSWTVKAFNWRFYRKHSAATRIVDYDTFFYPLDRILNYDRMYGKRGFLQYQAVIPKSAGREALGELLGTLAKTRSASFLAVLKSMGEQGEGLLSFPRLGYTLALDLPNTGQNVRATIEELDRIVLGHGGRIYLAKDAFMRGGLSLMYPRLGEFQAIQRRLDPARKVSSSLARRVGLIDS